LKAIDEEDDVALREELGDLLLQIILHTQMAVEDGEFTLAQVLETIIAKIVRRHPHVFGDLEVADADEVLRNWQAIKRAEKGEVDKPLWGMPLSMPALNLALRAQERAKRDGLASPGQEQLLTEIQSRLDHLRHTGGEEEAASEVGQLLFLLANLGRLLGVDPESALRTATLGFGEDLVSRRSDGDRDEEHGCSTR